MRSRLDALRLDSAGCSAVSSFLAAGGEEQRHNAVIIESKNINQFLGSASTFKRLLLDFDAHVIIEVACPLSNRQRLRRA